MPPRFDTDRAALVHPKGAFLALGVLLLAGVGLVGAFVMITQQWPLAALALQCVVLGARSLGYGARSTKNAKRTPGKITVERGALAFAGRVLAAKGALRQGFVEPSGEGAIVKLERGRFRAPIAIELPSEADGAKLLEALGFDARHTAAELRVASQILAMPVWKQLLICLPPVAVLVPLLPASMLMLGPRDAAMVVLPSMALVFAWVLTFGLSRIRVRVGTDGIATKWLGRERFIPFAEIMKAEAYEDFVGGKELRGVRLFTRGGEMVKLPTGSSDLAVSEAKQLLARIEAARDARSEDAIASTKGLLDRGRRDLGEWIASLRALGAGAVDHRTAAVPSDVLVRIVEDASAEPLDRATAAVAALSSDVPDVRDRIRVAADTSASQELRVALESLFEADDEEAAKTLGRLSQR